ncbi:MAG: hypothetical protein K9M49_10265 [Candidatus Marinimicrobia bacterium]|nr:hypothetical protein [Candidatus Neomarinimicrobiota bacterium]MCF7851154.1 hypothetical protein [Candidatus Neomarinimicrobiota bacterium]MCF7905519.1 hypothetical protein [Candidatus Neomarinimicrobiota bacterium]
MPRFLIEVPHENSKDACERAMNAFMATGSHFLTNADWGCYDGAHKAWLLVEVENKDQATQILPSLFRAKANIVELKRLNYQNADSAIEDHSGADPA